MDLPLKRNRTLPKKVSESKWKLPPGGSKNQGHDFSQDNFKKLSEPDELQLKKPLLETQKQTKGFEQTSVSDLWPSILSKLGTSSSSVDTSIASQLNVKKDFDLSAWSHWEREYRNVLLPLSRSGIEWFHKLAQADLNLLRRKLIEQPLSLQIYKPSSFSNCMPQEEYVDKLIQFHDLLYSSYHPILIEVVQASSSFFGSFASTESRGLATRLELASKDNESLAHISSLFSIVKYLVGENSQFIEQGHFQPLISYPSAPGAFQFRAQLALGSLHWLQQHFLQHIDSTLKKDLTSTNPTVCLGGHPTLQQRISAYIQLVICPTPSRLIQAWALLFYLFRCGQYEEALEFVETQESLDLQALNLTIPFEWLFRIFCTGERFILPPEYRLELFNIYETLPKDNPYLKAILQLMARVDILNITAKAVCQTQEDCLWWQFLLDQEDTRETPVTSDVLTIDNIKQFVTTKNFPSADLSYVKGLLLSHQFEKAVVELFKSPQYLPVALYLAISLIYYGLLTVPEIPCSKNLDILVDNKINLTQLWSQALPIVTPMSSDILFYYSVLLWLPNDNYHNLSMELGLDFMHAVRGYHSFLLAPPENFTFPLIQHHYQSLGDKFGGFRDRAFKEASEFCISCNQDFVLGFMLQWKIGKAALGLKLLYNELSKYIFTSLRNYITVPSQPQDFVSMNKLLAVIEDSFSLCLGDSVNFPSNLLYDTKCQLVQFAEITRALSNKLVAPIIEKAITFNLFPSDGSDKTLQSWAEFFKTLDPSVQAVLPYGLLAIAQGLIFHYPDLLHTTLNPEYQIHKFIRTAAKLVTSHPSIFPDEIIPGFASLIEFCRS